MATRPKESLTMPILPIICYRCTECDRIYEAIPNRCVCERTVFIKGERFGPFIILDTKGGDRIKVKCILCGNLKEVLCGGIKTQKSCGCKPWHAETLEITSEVLVYKCRKCNNTHTVRVPIAMYCCEDVEDGTNTERNW